MSNQLVAGAGGFIGGHLVKRLLSLKHNVVAVDIKPLEYWFQIFDDVKNYSLDLKDYDNIPGYFSAESWGCHNRLTLYGFTFICILQ